MYNQNFRNQAVKEIKNGSTVSSTAKKFSISPGTLVRWIGEYDEKMHEMIGEKAVKPEPVIRPTATGIELKSVKMIIHGSVVSLRRNDVLKMLKLFDIFDERVEEE